MTEGAAMTSNTDGAAQGEACTHDSQFLVVTGRERTGDDITWAIVTCRCGKLWQLADHHKAQAADVLVKALAELKGQAYVDWLLTAATEEATK